VIISDAPGHILDKLRRLSGPSPEGSKISDVERLHLIYLLAAMAEGASTGHVVYGAASYLRGQLHARGLTDDDIVTVIDEHALLSPVELADAIATHPKLQSSDYLD
jgi:hypothetical protein